MQSKIISFTSRTDQDLMPFDDSCLFKYMNTSYQKVEKHVKNICRFEAIYITCLTNEKK